MSKLERVTTTYLCQVLGDVSPLAPWEQVTSLPFYLQDRYQVSTAIIVGTPCLLILARDAGGETPAVVRKHLQAVQRHFTGPVIYVVEHITSYNRKRLVEQRVPFVVPNKQMYLPSLGLDLREQFSTKVDTREKPLGAVAQVLLLRELFQPGFYSVAAKLLAEQMDYSAMTIGRAFAELTDKNLAELEKIGREKQLKFLHRGKELWLEAQQYLADPIKKRIWVEGDLYSAQVPAAGETALAHYTMLSEPKCPVVAISAREWPSQKEFLNLNELPSCDGYGIQVELWSYKPCLIKEGNYVDELSLYLSMRGNNDERIAMAADELAGEMKW